MKKIFTCALIALSAQAFAQKSEATITPHIKGAYTLAGSRAIDTVDFPTPLAACIPDLALGLLTSGTDQVSGTNSFGDLEKAQYFNYAGGGNITGVIVLFGMKQANTGTSNYTVKLYTGTAAAGPGTTLGTSMPIGFGAIDTSVTSEGNTFMFVPSVPVPGDFFASTVVSTGTGTSDDTVAILSLFDGSNPTEPCGNGTAWEKQSDATWHAFNGSATTEWGVDLELFMLPIIDNSTSGIDDVSPVTMHKLYPNPVSNGVVNFSYALNTNVDVKMSLTDLSGKVIYTNTQPAQFSGVYNQTIDVSAFAAGMYTYTIEAGTHTITGKLIVQ